MVLNTKEKLEPLRISWRNSMIQNWQHSIRGRSKAVQFNGVLTLACHFPGK